jgi:signal peptidase I
MEAILVILIILIVGCIVYFLGSPSRQETIMAVSAGDIEKKVKAFKVKKFTDKTFVFNGCETDIQGKNLYVVVGDSMSPDIRDNDVIVAEKSNKDALLKFGHVIVLKIDRKQPVQIEYKLRKFKALYNSPANFDVWLDDYVAEHPNENIGEEEKRNIRENFEKYETQYNKDREATVFSESKTDEGKRKYSFHRAKLIDGIVEYIIPKEHITITQTIT